MPYKNNGITTRPYTPVHDETQTHLGKNWAQIGRKSLVTSAMCNVWLKTTATSQDSSCCYKRALGWNMEAGKECVQEVRGWNRVGVLNVGPWPSAAHRQHLSAMTYRGRAAAN